MLYHHSLFGVARSATARLSFDIQKEDGTQVYICKKCGAKYEIPYQFQDGYDNEHLEKKL